MYVFGIQVHVVCILMVVVRRVLFGVRRLWFDVRWVLCVVCFYSLMRVVSGVLIACLLVVRCSLFVVWFSTCVACCLLSDV